MKDQSTSDVIGFVLGFVLGCCGLLITIFFLRDSIRGAALGLAANVALGTVAGVVTKAQGNLLELAPAWPQTLPWELLLLTFGIGTTLLMATIAAAIWAFGGSGDDDDGPQDPPRPDDHQYVTFTR
jgi:hypothetical protein